MHVFYFGYAADLATDLPGKVLPIEASVHGEFDSAEILRIPQVKSRFVFTWYLDLFINYIEFNCQLQYVYLVVECVLITGCRS